MTSINAKETTEVNPAKTVLETVVFKLEISNSFDEWANHVDNSERNTRNAEGIQVLYRGLEVDSLNRVIIILQAKKGVIDGYVLAQADTFTCNGSKMETLVSQSYF
tara:strand:+ start:118 stop:435 length:318 start_codon:yes stop_codon:yes gene_type:complete